jgi:hypothetical protein
MCYRNSLTFVSGLERCGLLCRTSRADMPQSNQVGRQSHNEYTLSILYPAVDISRLTTPAELLADTVKRSPAAVLFHFYNPLCEIASIPRRTPSAWAFTNGTHKPDHHHHRSENRVKTSRYQSAENVLELDARALARDCLKVLGQEMGVSR